jgi:sugar lactone lactonase YvrE
MIYDHTICTLGEGPLWHPERGALFWFDIVGMRLHCKDRHWQFQEHVSAAGWVDHDRLLIASETQLFTFDLTTEEQTHICALEADNPVTRSNDGRADPQGGFWIGTMGKSAEEKAGSIYRYYRGELRQLFVGITIPNAICFAPDGNTAYFCDTALQQIMRIALDDAGWPTGLATVHIDARDEGLGLDGAVVDANGYLWSAQWGSARVAQYDQAGQFCQAVTFPARHTSCPAFGGPQLQTLFCTSATQGLDPAGVDDGKTFAIEIQTTGQTEHQVIL